MATTTTTTTTTRNLSSLTADGVLADYELHHSQIDSPISPNTPNDHHEIPNPPVDWDTTHRRVPPYRPINRDRDPLETRVYNSRAEQTFIGVMFTGVLTIATTAKVWHGTFGKLNDGIFRYQIGGEL